MAGSQRTRRHAKARRNKAIVKAAKEVPCMDCGEEYPHYVMDFDHVRGEKLIYMGKAMGSKLTVTQIAAEIDKCEIVCSNCHRQRTAERSGYDY